MGNVVLGLLALLLNMMVSYAQEPPPGTQEAILGFDPVILVNNGEEILGSEEITVTRNGFWYLFANQENRAKFLANPSRYEIQSEGLCSRMRFTLGKPDFFAVFKQRIYIFASQRCQEMFESAPEKYLEPEIPQVPITAQAEKSGRELLERALRAAGGAERIDTVHNYRLTGYREEILENKRTRVELTRTRGFGTQSFSVEAASTAQYQWGSVVKPEESFLSFSWMGQTSPASPAQHRILTAESFRDPLQVFRFRHHESFRVVWAGRRIVEEHELQQIWVSVENVEMKLGIDPASGQILTLSFIDRGPEGEYGEILKVFSDFRDVAGLKFLFQTTATFEGESFPEESLTVESIELDIEIDDSIFQKPEDK